MVAWKNNNNRILVVFHNLTACGGNRRSGISGNRLKHNLRLFHSNLIQLLRHDKTVRLIADNNRLRMFNSFKPKQGFLNHSFFAYKRQKLLGMTSARQRPKPCSGATRKNHRIKRHTNSKKRKSKLFFIYSILTQNE